MTRKRAAKPRPPAGSSPAFVPPYPPSWIDRLTGWVDRLLGPAWAFYTLVGVGVGFAGSAIEWMEGAYPAGTFNPLHVWAFGNFAYLLALIHYLDRSAATSMESFRPLLAPTARAAQPALQGEGTFALLSYQLTTLPPRPTLLVAIAGASFAFVTYLLQTATGSVPSYLAGAAGTTFSTASVVTMLVVQNAIMGVLAYHTIHQLVLISRIYTQHARINIYQLQPLYALSLPGALTAIGIILYIYLWFATSATGTATIGPVEVGLTVSFAAVAGATFALPLLGAHRRLVEEKDRRLAEASSRFEAATTQLHRQLDRGRLLQMDQLNKAVATLEIEQNVLRRIPTWPWQPGAVRGLFAALFLPVAVWAIQLFLGRVLGT